MSTYFFIFGKTPLLSIAELYAKYPKADFKSISPDFAIADLPGEFNQADFDQLGGSIKAAKVIRELDDETMIDDLADAVTSYYKDTKLEYGLSVYGMNEMQLRPILLKLKKALTKGGIKSRFINNQFRNITAAQYKSIARKGIEFVLVKDGGRMIVGETVGIQNIDSYSKRDYEKPFRDMKMGMLPPKLAQILINLTGTDGAIWDPFCGSGTLIMEGLLMGHPMIGSDANPRAVDGAQLNVEWVKNEFGIKTKAELFTHDATQSISEKFDAIACESDLGMPHSQYIRPELLQKIMAELDGLYIRFFQNLKNMKFKGPVVIALPFFRDANGRETLMIKTLAGIEQLGFKRAELLPESVKISDRTQLKYSRPDQAVGRAIYKFFL